MKLFSSLVFITALAAAAGTAFGGDMLEVGAPFPRFSLEAHDGSTISTETLKGTAFLVYFYPKADTPGCTREACEFRDRWQDVAAAGLTVLGVSYDTPKKNAAFAEKYSLPFLLLSDEDHELAAAVGAKNLLLPVPKRISYLVGGDGRILAAYPAVKPAEHAGEVLEDFRALQE